MILIKAAGHFISMPAMRGIYFGIVFKILVAQDEHVFIDAQVHILFQENGPGDIRAFIKVTIPRLGGAIIDGFSGWRVC